MLGYALSVALVLGSQYVFFRKIASKHEADAEKQASWRAQIRQFAWPFATWGIFYWAQSASDRWSLGLFATTQEVGLYAVLFQLGYAPMALAAGMALQFFAPIFYQRAGDASDSQRNANVRRVSRRLTAVTLGLTAGACLIALLFHSQIFGMLVAREYAPVSYLLPGVMLASGLFACGQTIGLDLLSQMKPRLMMTLTIVSSLVGVALNFIGAYLFGIPGVVVAGILFSAVYAVWMAMLSRRTPATN
jgi:O-antigen/teichoic acid export membrane protein